jgi:SNF2 family DNA or RNA helicase
MVITQPIIQSEWLAAAKLALKGTNMELIELASSKRATWMAADINLGDNVPDRGNKLYLISYDPLRSRASLKDASFGFVNYDESHSCKSWRFQLYRVLINMRAPLRMLLSGTPIHNRIYDWIHQLDWAMDEVPDDDWLHAHGPLAMRAAVKRAKRS